MNYDTPNEFYKNIRPEYFSDSKTTYRVELTKEILDFQLDNISKDQKQDQFEVLARHLAEKFIAANLIPQVGPTGGGDGKTDFETYPVSTNIVDRWFVPENGWKKDENWAFAISAKKEWKSKVKSDVCNILSTGRSYTKIFFITNQRIPSKQRKDVQDSINNDFKIDLTILDGQWITEKIFNNNLQILAVDSLNLSNTYRSKEIIKGKNDAERESLISEVESRIASPNRYFEVDFKLVEDCLAVAIWSREIEESRESIEGKFQRALRFAKKINNPNQLARIFYEQAWTAIFWFNDFEDFVENFKAFRQLINGSTNISIVKDYSTLITVLKTHQEFLQFIDIEQERNIFYDCLIERINDKEKLSTSLEAETYYRLSLIFDSLLTKNKVDEHFNRLSEIITATKGHLGYPFEQIYNSILVFGKTFTTSKSFDNLIDVLAAANEERHSELAASRTYIDRAIQKFQASLYQDAIVYLGKTVNKLGKEESKDMLINCLRLLSDAYRNLGLLWASHNCLISAAALSLKTFFSEGYINRCTYDICVSLGKNEILLGRIPSFLCVAELLSIISKQLQIEANENRDNTLDFLDVSLANRLLTFQDNHIQISQLPDILKEVDLEFSGDALLYKLGYIEEIIDSVNTQEFNSDKLDDFMSSIASQPIKDQLIYPTNFLDTDDIKLSSKVLGTIIEVNFIRDKSLFLIAEALLAFFEGLFATSLDKIMPTSEILHFKLIESSQYDLIHFAIDGSSNKFYFAVNCENFFKPDFRDQLLDSLMSATAVILQKNFLFKDLDDYLKNLFKNEEVFQRISLTFNHKYFVADFYGGDAKFFLKDWMTGRSIRTYDDKRKDGSLKIDSNKFGDRKLNSTRDFDQIPHHKRTVKSIIDVSLWDQAGWKGFGFFIDRDTKLGLTIFFDDFESGKKIFEGWIDKFGKEDMNEKIRIAIVKGIDIQNPSWYRVHISSNISNAPDGTIHLLTSRFHTLMPKNSSNLDNLISLYESQKEYIFCPAQIVDGGLMPDLGRGIKKCELIIKNAWEVSYTI